MPYFREMSDTKLIRYLECSLCRISNVEEVGGHGKREGPSTAIDNTSDCDKKWHPNIHILLQILCALSVPTAVVERSFLLSRIKNWLHSAVSDEPGNRLARLNINLGVDLVL